MRTLAVMALSVLASAPLAAQGGDPDKKVEGGGTLPAGWSARLDRPTGKMEDVKLAPMGAGMHITLGPSGIFYREADQVDGSFHTLATFNQTKAPQHPEAYGLFVGGKDLAGEGQSYIYFLVRGTGEYSIRQRNGAQVTDVTTGRNGWTASDAVVKQDSATGKASNRLEIQGDAKTGKLSFSVNGKKVHEMDATAEAFRGVVGLRVNHNIDAHIDGFAVHKL